MAEYDLPIQKKTLLSLSILSLILMVIATFLKVSQSEFSENYSDWWLGTALIFQIVPWIVVIIDLIRIPIRNKMVWFLGLFFLGSFVVILYLINREKHLRLYKRIRRI